MSTKKAKSRGQSLGGVVLDIMRDVEWNFQAINAIVSATKMSQIPPPKWPSYLSSEIKNNVNGLKTWLSVPDSVDKFDIQPENDQKHDPVNVYSYNSLNYRSPEFIESPDFLAIGCSHTWGVGVPDETIWPKVLSNLLGSVPYANLGIPGASTHTCVLSALSYIKQFGKPKKIFALLPDFRRLNSFIRTDANSMEVDKRNDSRYQYENEVEAGTIFFPQPGEGETTTVARYSKVPHVFSDVLPAEVPLFLSLSYLSIFQQYCKDQNIQLYLSSWDDETVDVYRHIGLDNFYYIDYERDVTGDDYTYLKDCHVDVNNYGTNWRKGADHTKEFGGHIGVHRHLDYAEMFSSVSKGE